MPPQTYKVGRVHLGDHKDGISQCSLFFQTQYSLMPFFTDSRHNATHPGTLCKHYQASLQGQAPRAIHSITDLMTFRKVNGVIPTLTFHFALLYLIKAIYFAHILCILYILI